MVKWLLPVALVAWLLLLRGFVPVKTLLVLSVFGPLLLVGGLGLLRVMGPRLLRSGWCAGAFVLGLAMIVGALATLAPAAPADLLVTTNFGRDQLDSRVARLKDAIVAGDAGLARRLASRGLGDTEPLDPGGAPLIHRATSAEVLAVLLDSGLDPDARDEMGRTPLMRARQPEAVRALLAAGANVDAQDREGFTVADTLPETLRAIVESHAGRPLARRETAASALGARTDWLTVNGDPTTLVSGSAVHIEPRQLRPGETATLTATFANPSAEHRWLDMEATLNSALLFVGASHGGAIEAPVRPRVDQVVRWPVLSLPPHSQGRIALQVVARSDLRNGQLRADWRVRTLPSRDDETLQIRQPLIDAGTTAAERGVPWLPAAALIATGVVLWLLWHRRQRPRSDGASASGIGSIAFAIAGGVALILTAVVGVFAWSIAEPWLRFEPAQCTILDQRVRTFTTTSGSTRGTPGGSMVSTPSTTRMGVAPLVAVRIEGRGAPVVTAGFDVGFTGSSVHDLRAFPLGSTHACWVDPSNATRFTLVRQPGLASILALAVMACIVLLLLAIARGLRGSP